MSDRNKPGDKGGMPPRPPAGGGGAKLLLSRLRALMANQAQDPKRLDRVVELIANTMVADVCSIYLRSEDESLLLMATRGLRPEAVGRTRMRENEGLVGLVSATARPLRLTDAFSHPRFSYRPETGEDPFHSFLGVPILRGGRVLGVMPHPDRSYLPTHMPDLRRTQLERGELPLDGDGMVVFREMVRVARAET